MSIINFTLPASIGNGEISTAEGRYKLSSSSVWTTFNIGNINNPQTPDIIIEGVYDLEVRVIFTEGSSEGWQPTRELDNNRNSNKNYSPFNKSFPDRPSYVLQDSKIIFFVNGFACKNIKIIYLEQPTLITESQQLNMPFVNELQDETVTLILENLESRRVQTQPSITKQ
jgi:hypothetical protein